MSRVTPVPRPTPSPTPRPTIKPIGEVKVYYSNNGTYYHASKDCGSMHDAPEHTLQEAMDAGKLPCPFRNCEGKVYPLSVLEDKDDVWIRDNVFHITDDCAALTGPATLMPLAEVLADGSITACPECDATLYAKPQ